MGASGAHLCPFYSTKLLNASVVVLNGPGITGEAHAGQGRHVEVIGGPPLLVAVWGNDLEQADQAIIFQMNDRSCSIGRDPRHGAQTT